MQKFFSSITTSAIVLFVFTLFVFGNSFGQEDTGHFAITNVTVIDGTGKGPHENATVIVKDGRIACVGKCNRMPMVEVEGVITAMDALDMK